jgi:poly(3-hydroxybutyrate) depolymerase
MSRAELRVVESAPLPYLLSVPPPREASAPLPLLCFLHGYDEAAPAGIERGVTRHGPLRPGSSARALEELIVVAPQLPRAGDVWRLYEGAVAEIVSQVRAAHPVDGERLYLTGFSFGGNGVFDLALSRPGAWTALWAVDPTRVPPADPGCPVWLSIGELARHGTSGFIRSLGLKPADAEPEGDRLYLDEGEDHVGAATLAYRDDRIYRWLLARRRVAPAPATS